MVLTRLVLHNLRNIETAELAPSDRLNLLYGPNGSGKTSLLEAIYLLGRGKSFRSAYSSRIVQHGQSELTIFGKCRSAAGNIHALGVQIRDGKFRAKVDTVLEQRSSRLAALLPLLLISPDGEKLIRGSPRQRRRFLDWGLFHVERGFLPVWQRYNRLLRQRNTLLRQHKRTLLPPWDNQLVESAVELDRFRRDYVDILARRTKQFLVELLDVDDVDFGYRSGWSKAETYGDVLAQSLDADLKAGFTQSGPHRADLSIRVKGRAAADVLSGGQQKLTACALLLAQAAVFNQCRGEHCIILVDDLPAELDTHHRQTFMALLYAIGGQLFVTTTDLNSIDLAGFTENQVFHVEQGRVARKGKTGHDQEGIILE